MVIKPYISAFVRWLLTWPLLVILALNIENFATAGGFANLLASLAGHWPSVVSLLGVFYAVLISKWVLYPALFLSGCIFYEWVLHIGSKLEYSHAWYRRLAARYVADANRGAFDKNGFSRKLVSENALVALNCRLEKVGLPVIPTFFNEDEDINKMIGLYLQYVSKGDFSFAEKFWTQVEPLAFAYEDLKESLGNAAETTEVPNPQESS